jgi:hypothetical protein
MPAQFATRGVDLLNAFGRANEGLLQAVLARRQLEQNNQEMAARRQMQQEALQAQREEQGRAIAARRGELAQHAENEAARDARLQENDLARIQAYQDKEQALRTFEATGGYTEGDVATLAAKRGLDPREVRQSLIQQKREQDQQQAINANFEAAKARKLGELSVADQRTMEDIGKLEKSLKDLPTNGSIPERLRPQIAQELQTEIFKKKSGLDRVPQEKPFSQTFKENTEFLPNGDWVFHDPQSGKITHGRAGNSGAAGAKTTANTPPSQAGRVPENDEFEVDEAAVNKKLLESRGDPSKPADREMAALAVRADKREQFMLDMMTAAYQKQGFAPADALQKAQKDRQEKTLTLKAREYVGSLQKNRVVNESLDAQGKPVPTSQPGPDDNDAVALEELKTMARQGDSGARQILAAQGVRW